VAVLPGPSDQLLTVSHVAEELQVTAETIRNWIDHGTLAAVRIGRGFRVRRSDVDQLLDKARAQSGSLATRRDLWHPTTSTLPVRYDSEATSIWDDTATPAVPTRRR
jgi:excisionase family DNA binding protein